MLIPFLQISASAAEQVSFEKVINTKKIVLTWSMSFLCGLLEVATAPCFISVDSNATVVGHVHPLKFDRPRDILRQSKISIVT